MATTTLSLTPLFRNSVGFDRFNDLFESVLRAGDEPGNAYPPYNIEKLGEDRYSIVMAVAGFSDKDISITAQNDQLTIQGRLEDRANAEVEYLHRGIAGRAFERIFRLADNMHIHSAELVNGLLTVHLQRIVPDEKKPRLIPISSAPAIDAKAERKKGN